MQSSLVVIVISMLLSGCVFFVGKKHVKPDGESKRVGIFLERDAEVTVTYKTNK